MRPSGSFSFSLATMIDWLHGLAPPTDLTSAQVTSYVLLDIFLIVTLARLLGSAMERIGQPRVVGEIIAGILLGPTLLGATLSGMIAPPEVRPILANIATVALILFMFLAGLEYDTGTIRGRVGQAGILATLSVVVPAVGGFLLALVMHRPSLTGPSGGSALAFGLFLGAALSVTAFPVMAHILMGRGELNTPLGSLAVAMAGIVSVLMFTYIALAASVAAAEGVGDFIRQIVFIALFGLGTWFIARPVAAWLLPKHMTPDGQLTGLAIAFLFGGMILFGLIAHVIGINALVGGFAWGVILPADRALRAIVIIRVKDVALIFLLPIFFAQAGFATDLKLLTPEALMYGLLFVVMAAAVKFAAAAPARVFGLSWRDVGVLGALTNTRGLLVLVVGLLGLEFGIIAQATFAIFVLMALVTNLMTLPLLRRLTPSKVTPPAFATEEVLMSADQVDG